MCYVGEFPARYRPLVWRFLLKLPENTSAFAALGTLVRCCCLSILMFICKYLETHIFRFNRFFFVWLANRCCLLVLFCLFYLLSSCLRCTVNRGVHEAYENLYDLYPIQNRKVFDRLQGLCSQLTHWAPILAEVRYCTVHMSCAALVCSYFIFASYNWRWSLGIFVGDMRFSN